MTPARQLRSGETALGSRRRMSQARPIAAAAINNHSAHVGHGPIRTIGPLAKTVRGYLKRSWNMEGSGGETFARRVSVRLVGHAVHDVIDADAKRHRGKRLRIVGAVGPFPRVAQMHVVADRDDD